MREPRLERGLLPRPARSCVRPARCSRRETSSEAVSEHRERRLHHDIARGRLQHAWQLPQLLAIDDSARRVTRAK